MRFDQYARAGFRPALLSVSVCCLLAAPRFAHAQAAGPLANIANKATLTAADQQRISARAAELSNALGKAIERDREKARLAIVNEFRQGSAAFRAAAANAAVQALKPSIVGDKIQVAMDALLVLIDLENAATREGFFSGLNSSSVGVRFLAARGLRDLQPRITDQRDITAALAKLSDAAQKEPSPIVIRMMYQAMDFSQQRSFRQLPALADALGDVLTKRLTQPGTNPANLMPAIQVAAKIGPQLQKPPRTLAAGLVTTLRLLADTAASDPSPVNISAVTDCETALHRVVDKHSADAAKVPSLVELLRAKPADETKIDDALSAWLGSKDRPGVLGRAPWRLPTS